MKALVLNRHIHFIGIGGIGMSALARFAMNFGVQVSGSDRQSSELTRQLEKEGARISYQHLAENIEDADLLVYSSAVPESNPERSAAQSRGIEQIRRADFLARVCSAYDRTVAVAGTHGKTTVSSMTAFLLHRCGLDTSALIGGIMQNFASNMLLGPGRSTIVVEADEYDRSFLTLSPSLSIITNIDLDHLDIYRDLQDIRDTFTRFASQTSTDGMNIICLDDPGIQSVQNHIPRSSSYAIDSPEADLLAFNIRYSPDGSFFSIRLAGTEYNNLHIPLFGKHNVLNSLAAIAAAYSLGIGIDDMIPVLGEFKGARRRFELIDSVGTVRFIDDYAHHPSEIRAALQAARHLNPDGRVIAIFQPHLYSRTRDLAAEFASALSCADLALVTDIYPAREQAIPGVSSQLILSSIPDNKKLYAGSLLNLASLLPELIRDGDILMFMGAGNLSDHIREYAARTREFMSHV